MSEEISLLIADDHPIFRRGLRAVIESDAELKIAGEADDGAAALAEIERLEPQIAILGVGAVQKRAVVINDAIAIRTMCYLSLSFDHRVIDGATADRFMSKVKNHLEHSEWEKLL